MQRISWYLLHQVERVEKFRLTFLALVNQEHCNEKMEDNTKKWKWSKISLNKNDRII
jgi:hypothetical protein